MPARFVALVACAFFLLPAVASATTFTVDPADPDKACGGADTVCATISQAVQAAGSNDLIKVLKGTYAESVSVGAGKDNLRIDGTGAGDVKVIGSGGGDVVSIASGGVRVGGMTIEVPAAGASAVEVGGPSAELASLVLQRAAGVNENHPVVNFTDGGSGRLTGSFVVQAVGPAGTPGVRSTGGGLLIADSVILSSTGPAVVISGSETARVLRSTLAATERSSDALRVLSDDAGQRTLVTDSSIFVGGADAAGILARSTGTTAGNIVLQVRHATIAGSAKGIVVDASDATGTGGTLLTSGTAAGSIDADVFSSIVHGTSSAARYEDASLGLAGTSNTASLTFANSDAPPPGEGNGSVEMGGATFTEDAKLFAPKSLKLRADAPLIDKGGPLQSGESATDVDGQPRESDGPDADATPQSDVGADEYVNQPPKALFGITNKSPREGEPVGFISGSTDPEQDSGGGIAEYRWNFGDGTTEITKVGGVAHTYTKAGTYRATLQVVDVHGVASAVTPPQEIVVREGAPPAVAITAPANNARVNLRSTYLLGRKKPKSRQLTILGTVADASGVESVEVALYVTKRAKVRRAKKRRSARRSQAAPKRCEFYSGRVFSKRACSKEIWVKAALVPGGFQLKTRKGLRLPAGLYQIKVRAKDTTGLLSRGFDTKSRTLVNFRVK